jgi:hypothetical protein
MRPARILARRISVAAVCLMAGVLVAFASIAMALLVTPMQLVGRGVHTSPCHRSGPGAGVPPLQGWNPIPAGTHRDPFGPEIFDLNGPWWHLPPSVLAPPPGHGRDDTS